MPTIEPYVFSDAVRHYWGTRTRQSSEQESRGQSDQGDRSSVTGGKHLDGFIDKIVALLGQAGVPFTDIHTGKSPTTLPGYFRAKKTWDLLVVSSGELRAVIELKSIAGSFGYNLNNRTEEALGNAQDIWTAYRKQAFVPSHQPWVGYLFLLADVEKSRTPVRVKEPHFKVLKEFKGASYAKRAELLCRRLVLERQYSSACFLLSDPADWEKSENYREPAEDLSASRFLSQLVHHVTAP